MVYPMKKEIESLIFQGAVTIVLLQIPKSLEDCFVYEYASATVITSLNHGRSNLI